MWLLAGLVAVPILLAALSAGILSGLQSSAPVGSYAPSPFALRDIPADYLRTYQSAGAGIGGWEYLAAIGKIETTELIGKGKSQITMDRVPMERISCYAAEDAACSATKSLEPASASETSRLPFSP